MTCASPLVGRQRKSAQGLLRGRFGGDALAIQAVASLGKVERLALCLPAIPGEQRQGEEGGGNDKRHDTLESH